MYGWCFFFTCWKFCEIDVRINILVEVILYADYTFFRLRGLSAVKDRHYLPSNSPPSCFSHFHEFFANI